jgi:hypothetical protein
MKGGNDNKSGSNYQMRTDNQFRGKLPQRFSRPQGAYAEDETSDKENGEPYNDPPSRQDQQDQHGESPVDWDGYPQDPAAGEQAPDESQQQTEFGLFTTGTSIRCRQCSKEFSSNNKLHKHLRTECTKSRKSKDNPPQRELPMKTKSIIVTSDVTPETEVAHTSQTWKYVMAKARFAEDASHEDICIDTGCTMSIIDRLFLKKVLPEAQPTKVSMIPIRGIGKTVQKCDEYVTFTLFLPGRHRRLATRYQSEPAPCPQP